jgi:3,4-dihydroxy 2-butanone 4-phosphate synthase
MAIICEMLGDDGGSLPPAQAGEYAEEHGLVYIEGREVIAQIKKFIK